ncbi:MAG: relaxase/mobilization nuclease domain-containing protein [Eubacteriales bacterium]
MATVNFINYKSQSKTKLKKALDYVTQDAKVGHDGTKLVSGFNCMSDTAYADFLMTKKLYEKESGRQFYHFVQSFSPYENITPEVAHEVALRLAAFYKDYEVLVATHVDRDHIHSHFILNSVSFETGKKLHQNGEDIKKVRTYSDELCKEFGLSVCHPKQKTEPITGKEYHTAVRGESWKFQLMNTIDGCMAHSKSKKQFLKLMTDKGYRIRWEQSRKHITYTTPEGRKCRCNKLHDLKYTKEMMELEFRIREQIIARRTQETQPIRVNDTAERATVDTDTRPLGTDFHEPERDLRQARDGGIGTPQPENTVPPNSHKQGNRGSESQTKTDSILARTGWEEEREQVFAPKSSTPRDRHRSDDPTCEHDILLLGDVVQLGKAVESLGEQPYEEAVQDCTTIPHHIDKKRLKEMREKGLTQSM